MTCERCGKPLVGRQTKFCSDICNKQTWRELHRERDRAWSQAWKERNRERNRARDNEFNRTHRGRCSRCGGPTGRQYDGHVCTSCHRQLAHERREELARLWRDGLTFPEIMEAFGWTKGHLAAELGRIRSLGYDAPYRYKRKAAA